MNNFKVSHRELHSDNRSSITDRHFKRIEESQLEFNSLEKYKNELNFLLQAQKTIDNRSSIIEISEKIEALKLKIKKIEGQEDLHEYLFDAMSFIKNIDAHDAVDVSEQIIGDENKAGIMKYVNINGETKKGEIYRQYMEKCFPNEIKPLYISTNDNYTCSVCKSSMVNDSASGLNICYTCGSTEKYVNNSNLEWNVSETHEFTKPYSYKRTNHFKEWLTQIQGQEGTTVPESVIELIMIEIKKERLDNKKLITYSKIKEFLKKLKLNKYYEHIPNIIHKITGNKQLIINKELEDKLINMFNEIQDPFSKHCPKNRKNFLSYSYTLYKFFQILKKNEYLVYFPLLKSREKLFEQESIWKNICKDLNWEFIKCI